jgi:ParB/RepB/Spo0J family partition protein
MQTQFIAPDKITVPNYVERDYDKVKDDQLRQSIENSTIHDPLLVIENAGELLLIDGLRRLRVAKSLGMPKVPVGLDEGQPGGDIERYIRKTRFLIDHHRQNLTPTQKADMITFCKETYGMTHAQVAQFLGISADTVTNYLAARNYIPEVQAAVDRGLITMHAARVFDGLSEEGQQKIWKAHASELQKEAGSAIHHRLRREYSPTKYPSFYRNPESTKGRMNRTGKRQAKKRPSITPAEKQRLMSSFEMKEIELKTGQEELDQMKREIKAAIPPLASIMRNEDLWQLVPDEMKPELERFKEVYI